MSCLNEIPTAEKMYSDTQISLLDKTQIPRHIAIIPDGNRRWAKQKQSLAESGHREGADTIMDTVKASKELGIKVVTIYLFSTENWNRPQEEIAGLMWLLQCYLIEQKQTMVDNQIRLQTIGDLSRLPPSVMESIEDTKNATKDCDKIEMVFALNYGGRDDIRRGVQALIKDVQGGKIHEEISEALISSYLDTAPWGDPDLLIRTSGELRISNFLLWQISYAEIFIIDILWPDFNSEHLLTALLDFQQRHRRLGGT